MPGRVDDQLSDGEPLLEPLDGQPDLGAGLEILADDPDAAARGDRRRIEDQTGVTLVRGRDPDTAGDERGADEGAEQLEKVTPARPMG